MQKDNKIESIDDDCGKMRVVVVADALGLVLMLVSPTFLIPAVVGLYFGESSGAMMMTFVLPALLTFLVGIILRRLGPETYEIMREREGYVVAASTWLLVPLFGGIPYLISGVLMDPIDAYFESMSGFTTTGASVILDLEHGIPHSILLWRSLTAWLGGMGIIVLFMVFLSRLLGAGAARLLKAEVSGHTVTRLSPKLQLTAVKLWGIYAVFTAAEIILLCAAGMPPFDSVCHSFTTISTCGFGTKNASIGAYNNPMIEGITVVFLIMGATNFNVHHDFFRQRWKSYIQDTEFRFFILVLTLLTIIIVGDLSVNRYYSLVDAVRYGTFNTVSFLATGGFVTADMTIWPQTSQFTLMVILLMGGCGGSTAGGLKMFRILLLLKMGRREVQKILHPKAIFNITLGGRVVSEETIKSITAFFFLYISTWVICSLLLTISGLDITTSTTAVASCLTSVGPAFGTAFWSYSGVHPAAKLILTLCMWVGRLELLAALTLLAPSSYKE